MKETLTTYKRHLKNVLYDNSKMSWGGFQDMSRRLLKDFLTSQLFILQHESKVSHNILKTSTKMNSNGTQDDFLSSFSDAQKSICLCYWIILRCALHIRLTTSNLWKLLHIVEQTALNEITQHCWKGKTK